ncbi:MAG: GIY-YIG nuclease family protein [Candidatus Moranbacteria bacterium]|nr:GIY-YIG nuclease family protein [Candidatus Moranbacteria bacterium]
MKQYFVYLLTNNSGALYVGFTSNLKNRIWEHKNKIIKGFTERYNIDKIIYLEQTENVYSAIQREKQLKGWTRKKKIALFEKENPEWRDLYDEL